MMNAIDTALLSSGLHSSDWHYKKRLQDSLSAISHSVSIFCLPAYDQIFQAFPFIFIFAYCKWSSTWGGNGMGKRLHKLHI